VRNVGLGLAVGVVATLALGQARAPDRRQAAPAPAAPVARYQITATKDANGNDYLFILDHETQQVHRRSAHSIGGQSPTVADLIRASS
jgi:hypothetical protein